ncbi:peptidylprolyl isomerase [Pontibacter sp. JAM-7]|uniref:peptidylprolyl isomerase n=1 Tax=Pontibacter sp. JAM-7 TaxID=3366581 RepID=UPI003AF75126
MRHILLSLCLMLTAAFSHAEAEQVNPQVILQTSQGTIELELFPEQAPETVANFLTYVDDGFYNNTIFHRVIRGFMIQGGGFTADLDRKVTRAPVRNESNNGLANLQGTIAMARTSNPDSATAQFFINAADNPMLNLRPGRMGYTVFGRVVNGMDVVIKINNLPTMMKGSHRDVPEQDVTIEKAFRKNAQ